MSSAIITTASGGIFVINDAFMVTSDVIVGTVGGEPYTYEVQEGDSGKFVANAPTAAPVEAEVPCG